jgi:hypothetical protein
MSSIIVVYFGSVPNFPATDQNVSATRYGPFVSAGKTVFVDALNGVPTQGEIDLAVTPPPNANQIRVSALQSDTQTATLLALLRTATPAQIDTYVNNNAANLAGAQQVLKNLIKLVGLISITQ